ncbi:WD-repeat containing protein [Sulfurimonas gotlandica GD1]|uniref:WD-repeat containing protein n=1 Tax=Sulfurimonas gotlandica (strain DSM 19862 / JCM 16533 / GD1) TaxID=929558 RepID=B6BL08_SULGG|nr:DUF4062 domain-containing protein [Sulfurimonas gotlandica]EDZ62152.1 WD domain, G-beta repeat protein [Sulfurimonas gotlandica GD1]EHP28740.1 WD-repeat containing protein [Sulfurimonas gotlandica GD1]
MNYNFRVFISSTFDDFSIERNILKSLVWPEIESYCQKRGATFQAIDLRWGIPPELADSLDVVNICLDEVKNCKRISPSPNFISLIGDRYGWRPIPKKVPSTILNKLILNNKCEESDKNFILKYYLEDRNELPAIYILNEDINEENYTVLLNLLRKLSKDDNDASKYFMYSATHQEIIEGILNDKDVVENNHYFSAFRTIDKLYDSKQNELILKKYTDTNTLQNGKIVIDDEASSLLEDLRNDIKTTLKDKDDQIINYSALLDNNGNIIIDEELELFCIKIENWLKKVLDKELKRLLEIDSLTHEIKAHETFLENRVNEFYGRKELLKSFEYNLSKSDSLCICGEGGTGKSTAMAKCISRTITNNTNLLVIYRFIGATPDSVNVDTLLRSIILQIQKELNISMDFEGDIYELTNILYDLLIEATASNKVIIFFDALDQLEDKNDAWALSWLPKAISNFQLIVSVVSTTTLFSNYKRIIKQKGYNNKIIELNKFKINEKELSNIVDHLLRLKSRQVTLEQKKVILEKYSKSSNSMLYLKLATIVVSKWKSYDDQNDLILKKMGLQNSTSELIINYFDYLSTQENHGKKFILSVLSLISNSRYGVSEKELLEITWKNKEYQTEFELRKHPTQPNVDKIPSFIWSKLYSELEPFFMFRSYDGTLLLTFFHRIFLEEARRYTKSIKEYTHQLIFEHFNNKQISPFYFVNSRGVPFINKRKITELPYSLACISQSQHKYQKDIKDLFLDFHFLFSKVIIGRSYELIDDFKNLGNIKNKIEFENINLIYIALRQEIAFIQKHPSQLLQSLWNKCWWHDNPKINNFTNENINVLEKEKYLYEYLEEWKDSMLLIDPSFQWCKSLRPPVNSLKGTQVDMYRGHPAPVCFVGLTSNQHIISISNIGEFISWDTKTQKTIKTIKIDDIKSFQFKPNSKTKFTDKTEVIYEGGGVLADHPGFEFWAWYGISNEQSNKFISGSDDGTIFLIEITEDGITKNKLYKHNAPIRALKFSKNENYLVSGAGDGTIKLFSFITNELITTLEHEEGWVNSVDVTNDGKKIFSVGGDCYLYIWESIDDLFNLNQKLLEHTDRIWCLTLSHDEKYIATGSDDKKVILWRLDEQKNNFKYFNEHSIHTRWVQTVAFNYNNTLLASSGGDGKIVLWNTKDNILSSTLTGNDDSIYSLGFAKKDNLLVSGSRDRTVRLWDINNFKSDWELDEHKERIECAAFSKNGIYLATGSSDGSIIVRYAENDLLFKQFKCNNRVVTLDFTSNKLGLVYGYMNNIVFRNLSDNCESLISNNKTTNNEEIECLKVSLDDKYILSTHKNKNAGNIKLWRLFDKKLLDSINIQNDYFLDIAVSNEGEKIACSSKNGYVYCYIIKNQRLIFDKKKKIFTTWADGVIFSSDSKFIELKGGSWGAKEVVIIEYDTLDNERSRRKLDGSIGSFDEYAFSIDATEISIQQKDKNYLFYPGTLEFSVMHPNKRQWVGVQRYNHTHIRLEGGA